MGTLSPPQTNRRVPQATKLKVFVSYSRDDLKFADQLDAALDLYGFESVIDRQGISGGEDWKRRLGGLIRDTDTVVFVLSPTSARSEICAWEVEEALRLGKRILPVLCRPLDGASPPPRLEELNYIYFYDGSSCIRRALSNGRCANHGGLSTGAKTDAGRRRIAEAQRRRWDMWRAQRAAAGVSNADGSSTDRRLGRQ